MKTDDLSNVFINSKKGSNRSNFVFRLQIGYTMNSAKYSMWN